MLSDLVVTFVGKFHGIEGFEECLMCDDWVPVSEFDNQRKVCHTCSNTLNASINNEQNSITRYNNQN